MEDGQVAQYKENGGVIYEWDRAKGHLDAAEKLKQRNHTMTSVVCITLNHKVQIILSGIVFSGIQLISESSY